MGTTVTKNKVSFGLKNVYIFAVTAAEDGTAPVYATTAVALPGAVKIEREAQMKTLKVAADNRDDYVDKEYLNGYDGALTLKELSEEAKAIMFADAKNADGVIIEDQNNTGKRFAMAYQYEGDEKATRYIDYNCKASRPKASSETTDGDEITTNDLEVNIRSYPIHNGTAVRAYCEEGSTKYDNWFTTVYQPSATSEE